MREFSSANAALAETSQSRLRRMAGRQAAEALAEFRRCVSYVLRERVADRSVIDGWKPLLDYLRADMGSEAVEQFRVLYLDTRNGLIADEIASRGTIDAAPVYVREVIHRALDLGAAALILAHNHPSGNPAPSRSDIALTRTIAAAGKPLGIVLHDHVVVSRMTHSSLRAEGLLGP